MQLDVQAGKLASIGFDAQELSLHTLGHGWAIHPLEHDPSTPGYIDNFNRFRDNTRQLASLHVELDSIIRARGSLHSTNGSSEIWSGNPQFFQSI